MDSERSDPPATLDRRGYELEVDETFAGRLDPRLWLPHYLAHWSSREASAARYDVGDGSLRLRIDADQAPWSPELEGGLRVSSLQTGLFAGPVGSSVGQHRFRPDLVVREAQANVRLYVPRHGLFELRARAIDDPAAMVALWMIGYEDEPARSAEICIFEIFGRDVGADMVSVGMGVHPFDDPSIRDEFEQVSLEIDARDLHDYAAEWTTSWVAFYVDEVLVKIVRQAPSYPMQFMLSIYELADGPDRPSQSDAYPKVFEVRRFRGWRPSRAR